MINKIKAVRDGGSFRDPAGYIFSSENDIYRTVNATALTNFKIVLESGVIQEMVNRGLLISTAIVDSNEFDPSMFVGARGEMPELLLKHPRVPFISYSYEWTFEQLKTAALAHLELQIQCLEFDITLSDASSFNMQFVEGKFKHIDILSLKPYVEGEPWAGYNQFCKMFVAPLLIEAWVGIPFQSLLRGRIDGLNLNEVNRILPKFRRYTSLNALLHISLQAYMISKADSSKKLVTASNKIKLPRNRYKALLVELKSWISELKSGRQTRTYWNTYASENTYSEEMRRVKHVFIKDWAQNIPNGVVWDIGGNTGDYSRAAVEAGVSLAVIFDSDIDSLEKAYSASKKGEPFLPLLMDIADPSPQQGWNQRERAGLNERSRPDGLIALAVIHHLAIGRNLPLVEIVDWMVTTAQHGIIEFVPKTDPMIVEMLSGREDIFDNYDEQHFLEYLSERAEITRQHRFSANNRLIVSYVRK
jgi:ribosomal protein L11 methylase PrmA